MSYANVIMHDAVNELFSCICPDPLFLGDCRGMDPSYCEICLLMPSSSASMSSSG
jgi:hypothetical protein